MTCKVNEAASLKLFFSSHTIYFTLLNNCLTHSHTSRTIASSQYHPRETRSLIGQPNLYKKSFIGFAYERTSSHNDQICCKRFADSKKMNKQNDCNEKIRFLFVVCLQSILYVERRTKRAIYLTCSLSSHQGLSLPLSLYIYHTNSHSFIGLFHFSYSATRFTYQFNYTLQ